MWSINKVNNGYIVKKECTSDTSKNDTILYGTLYAFTTIEEALAFIKCELDKVVL